VALYLPASQLVQTVDAVPAEYFPASQISHAELTDALYLGHTSLARAVVLASEITPI